MFQGSTTGSIQQRVLQQAPANLQRGLETVGGRLILTADALHFQPHAFNIQTQSLTIMLLQIASLQLCWTRLLGLLPLAPTCWRCSWPMAASIASYLANASSGCAPSRRPAMPNARPPHRRHCHSHRRRFRATGGLRAKRRCMPVAPRA